MALTCADMIDEIQAITGRTSDTVLIDNTYCTRRINEAMVYIVDNCPQLRDLEFKNTKSLDFSANKISYAIGDITAGDTTKENGAAHIFGVWYLDGVESILLDFQPTDEFDAALIDPTSSDHSANKPTRWTRRGDNIEVAPRPSSSYEKDMRVDGVRYAAAFATDSTAVCEIANADDLLIKYSISEAYGAMGNETASAIWQQKFQNSFANFRDKHGRMEAWDGQVWMDYPEGVDEAD